MPNGKEVAYELRKSKSGGIPWSVILDESGEPLVTADGPKGNIGCPVEDHEREWFVKMLVKTKVHCSDDDVKMMSKELDVYTKVIREDLERRRKEYEAKRKASQKKEKKKK